MTLSCSLSTDGASVAVVVENTGARPVDLTFPDGQTVEVVIEGTDTHWRYGADRLFTQAMRTETLEPGACLQERVEWPTPVSGTYDVRAWLCASNVQCAASGTLTI